MYVGLHLLKRFAFWFGSTRSWTLYGFKLFQWLLHLYIINLEESTGKWSICWWLLPSSSSLSSYSLSWEVQHPWYIAALNKHMIHLPNIQSPFPFVFLNTILCSYSSHFNLPCDDRRRTLLNLTNSGSCAIENIDYTNHKVNLTDPSGCLPRQFLNFDLSCSPFYLSTWWQLHLLQLHTVECDHVFVLQGDPMHEWYELCSCCHIFLVPPVEETWRRAALL